MNAIQLILLLLCKIGISKIYDPCMCRWCTRINLIKHLTGFVCYKCSFHLFLCIMCSCIKTFLTNHASMFLLIFSRWRSNHMCWMTKCAMNARVRGVVASLLRSFVPMWHACSTIANSVGLLFTLAPDVNSTNPSSRKVGTALDRFHSVGKAMIVRPAAHTSCRAHCPSLRKTN